LPLRVAVWAMALTFAALVDWQAAQRVATFHNHTFDLAEYARIAWGLAHGSFWDPIIDTPFWGGHLSFVLAPLGLLGRLFGTVRVLLAAQALCMALTALPLARIGARRLGPYGAPVAAAAYLLHPNLGHVASYEFHPGNLALLPLALALDALDRRAPRALCGWVLAIVLCRADLALVTLMLGASALVLSASPPALRRAGVWLALGSLAYFALALWLQVHHARVQGSAALHFGVWGGSPLGVLAALVHDPARVLAHFGAPERLLYVPKILAPLLWLPLLQPRWLLPALPLIAINLISAFPTTTWLDSHYLTPALPTLVVAAVHAAARLRSTAVLGLLPAAALGASLLAGGLPWSRDRSPTDFVPGPEHDALARLLDMIPPGVSVQAPDRLLPHLVERVRVHRTPPPERGTDFVVLDTSHRSRFAGREDLLRTVEEPALRRFLGRGDHRAIASAPDLLLLWRGGEARSGLAARFFRDSPPPWELPGYQSFCGMGRREQGDELSRVLPVRLCACLELHSVLRTPEGVELELTAHSACPDDLALRIGIDPKPARVQLLFDGVLSPAQLRAGDRVRSVHAVPAAELNRAASAGLHVGALRSSGAPPEPGDPVSTRVPVW
jgi:uncharacterized membrane protein